MTTTATAAPRVKQSQLARELSVSRQAVNDLVKRGVLQVGADGLIDLELARVALANRVRPSAKSARATDPNGAARADAGRASGGKAAEGDSYYAARTEREQAEAKLAQLALAEKLGELVKASDVEAALASKLVGARDVLLTLADRLAPVLAAESDAEKVRALLHREIAEGMRGISLQAPAQSS